MIYYHVSYLFYSLFRFKFFWHSTIIERNEATGKRESSPSRNSKGGNEMKKNTTMACGCAVVIDENGKMVTSIDMLAKGASRLFARANSRQVQNRVAAVRA